MIGPMSTEKIIHLGQVLGTKILAQNSQKCFFFLFFKDFEGKTPPNWYNYALILVGVIVHGGLLATQKEFCTLIIVLLQKL